MRLTHFSLKQAHFISLTNKNNTLTRNVSCCLPRCWKRIKEGVKKKYTDAQFFTQELKSQQENFQELESLLGTRCFQQRLDASAGYQVFIKNQLILRRAQSEKTLLSMVERKRKTPSGYKLITSTLRDITRQVLQLLSHLVLFSTASDT